MLELGTSVCPSDQCDPFQYSASGIPALVSGPTATHSRAVGQAILPDEKDVKFVPAGTGSADRDQRAPFHRSVTSEAGSCRLSAPAQ